MGKLIGWRYPTGLALNLADHTYVSCDTGGKAWGCWGGKSGGTSITHGQGSTARADAIAGHDERAGITCYLVNGVCHQAANRILFPSGRTVRKARGYWVSEAIYGTYGRPRGAMGLCRAPFHQHQGVWGDIPECAHGAPEVQEPTEYSFRSDDDPADMGTYLKVVVRLYDQVRRPVLSLQFYPEHLKGFQVALFSEMVKFKLGSEFVMSTRWEDLRTTRSRLEDSRFELEERFTQKLLPVDEFVVEYNSLIEGFQKEAASILAKDYETLFEIPLGETVILGDPRIAHAAYGVVGG